MTRTLDPPIAGPRGGAARALAEPLADGPIDGEQDVPVGAGPARGDLPHEPALHHHHVPHVPSPGGSFVAAIAAYEVVAVTVNRALDLDVLPSVTTAVRRFRWHRVVFGVLTAGALASMWATIVVVAGAMVARASRSRRR